MISTGIFVPASNTPRVAKQDVSCVASLFLAAPCVTFAVTTDAKLDQVVHHIAAELAPGFHVVDSHGSPSGNTLFGAIQGNALLETHQRTSVSLTSNTAST